MKPFEEHPNFREISELPDVCFIFTLPQGYERNALATVIV